MNCSREVLLPKCYLSSPNDETLGLLSVSMRSPCAVCSSANHLRVPIVTINLMLRLHTPRLPFVSSGSDLSYVATMPWYGPTVKIVDCRFESDLRSPRSQCWGRRQTGRCWEAIRRGDTVRSDKPHSHCDRSAPWTTCPIRRIGLSTDHKSLPVYDRAFTTVHKIWRSRTDPSIEKISSHRLFQGLPRRASVPLPDRCSDCEVRSLILSIVATDHSARADRATKQERCLRIQRLDRCPSRCSEPSPTFVTVRVTRIVSPVTTDLALLHLGS